MTMRVALVHYWLVGMAGGEKVLEALCRIYPQADIFTHVLKREALSPLLARHRIRTTFIGRLPFAARHYQAYLPLMPLALEQLDLTGYDLVISSESGPAKGVVTRADTAHLCYCHTPMRYLWDHWSDYMGHASPLRRAGMKLFLPYLRRADVLSSFRVDRFLANSATVAARVRKHWRREAVVVPPPVDLARFRPRQQAGGEYYICIGRLTAYKRVDLAIEACARLGRKLMIVGGGEELAKLRNLACPDICFAGRLDDTATALVLAGARALLFPGEEDFGIVPVEAMAAGVPVIAYGRGGATESVLPGETGLFFGRQDADHLVEAILEFERREKDFDPAACRKRAESYSEENFARRIRHEVAETFSAMREGGQRACRETAP